jgi:DNA-directed RNA polymerase subunit RPC12/RpoP
MELVFCGDLRYVCPRCGDVQKKLVFRSLEGRSFEAYFRVYRGRIKALQEDDSWWHLDEDLGFRCPSCWKELTLQEVLKGLGKWLEMMRKIDPQTYSEVMSRMFDTWLRL